MTSQKIVLILLIVMICIIVYYYYYSESILKDIPSKSDKSSKHVTFNDELEFEPTPIESFDSEYIDDIFNELNSVKPKSNKWDSVFNQPLIDKAQETVFLTKMRGENKKYVKSMSKYDKYTKDKDLDVIFNDNDVFDRESADKYKGLKIADVYDGMTKGPQFKSKKIKKRNDEEIIYEEDGDDDDIKAFSGDNYHSAFFTDGF